MCGICGSTRASEERLRAMSAALLHRGPDDDGVYLDGASGTGLAARRLSIIDVEGGHQPLCNEDGTVWAVLNGEIYNHPALRRRLAANGHMLRTATDTEVLVHLYEEFGPELVHALEGMFAFAIWDAARCTLVLGRDRFGEKPLFFTERHGEVEFASELSALAAGLDGAVPSIDEAAIDQYFLFGYVAGSSSAVQGIRQLPAGHVLVRHDGTSVVRQYWRPPVHARALSGGRPELREELRRLLEASVRSRLIADVPIGLFLSGGVDSTLVGTLALQAGGAHLKTFSVGYDVGETGETGPARRAAQSIGSEHHELVLSEADVAERAIGALARLDQPLGDPAFVALHALAEFARHEVKVAVGGEGADELFGGYPRYAWIERAMRVGGGADGRVRLAAPFTRRLSGRASRLVAAAGSRDPFDANFGWVTAGRAARRSELYGPRLVDACSHAVDSSQLRSIVGNPDSDVAGELMRMDQLIWLPDDVLVKADRASMQVSLELRTPYLSRELAEFAATIPSSTHVAGGGKQLLRDVLRAELPGADHRRRKIAFRVPAAQWLRGPLAPALRAQIEDGRLCRDGWFERAPLLAMARDHAEGHDRTDVLWPIFALGAWLDGDGSRYG
jgi:asparagine synthase (glutamine-hydrolysing)